MSAKTKWPSETAFKNFKDIRAPSDINISANFRATSLDSLANSTKSSESTSDDSHDSDSGTDTKSKNSFVVKCEVYEQQGCGSIRSWTKSDSSDSYEYVTSNTSGTEGESSPKGIAPASLLLLAGEKKSKMETIPEENVEPKVSVKEILARFENLRGEKEEKNSSSGQSVPETPPESPTNLVQPQNVNNNVRFVENL